MPVIYIDILFAINFFIDMLLVSLTLKITGKHIKKWRLLLASIIGAVYACCIFFPQLSILYLIVFKIAVSMLIVLIASKYDNLVDFIKTVGIFYFTTLLFGGCVYGIMYFTSLGSKIDLLLVNGSLYLNLPFIKLLIISACIFAVLILVVKGLKEYLLKQGVIGSMTLWLGERTIRVSILFDTGNNLIDPVTHLPVIVTELCSIRNILPIDMICAAQSGDFSNIDSQSPWLKRLRMIPYQAIGTENGMLVGFRPDRVILHMANGKSKDCNCIIALYHGEINKTNGCNAIVNPGITI